MVFGLHDEREKMIKALSCVGPSTRGGLLFHCTYSSAPKGQMYKKLYATHST